MHQNQLANVLVNFTKVIAYRLQFNAQQYALMLEHFFAAGIPNSNPVSPIKSSSVMPHRNTAYMNSILGCDDNQSIGDRWQPWGF